MSLEEIAPAGFRDELLINGLGTTEDGFESLGRGGADYDHERNSSQSEKLRRGLEHQSFHHLH
jgi:hypothetical protein